MPGTDKPFTVEIPVGTDNLRGKFLEALAGLWDEAIEPRLTGLLVVEGGIEVRLRYSCRDGSKLVVAREVGITELPWSDPDSSPATGPTSSLEAFTEGIREGVLERLIEEELEQLWGEGPPL